MQELKDAVVPSAVPTEDEIRRWQALPRDEQLRRMQQLFAEPQSTTLGTMTMANIRETARAHIAKRNDG